jgi:hypothetical protein
MLNWTYATLFVCDGAYHRSDFERWVGPFESSPVMVVVAGGCPFPTAHMENVRVHRMRRPTTVYATANARYRYMRAKFELWALPYDRVVYYDLDVLVKRPVGACAARCASAFCAVRDPVVQWRLQVGPYFNSGFMVLRPSHKTHSDLIATRPTRSGMFGDQDTLNSYFKGKWQKLPKECNWLQYKENAPGALTDPRVLAVHKP